MWILLGILLATMVGVGCEGGGGGEEENTEFVAEEEGIYWGAGARQKRTR